MASISIFDHPRKLTFPVMREALHACIASGKRPDRIVTHSDQRKRYALFFGKQDHSFTYDGIDIIADDTLPRDVMEFRLGDQPLAVIRNLVF